MPNITIDGKDYDVDDLSEEARTQLTSVNVADDRINRLKAELSIAATARAAYAQALKDKLPEPVPDTEEEGHVVIDSKTYSLAAFSEEASSEFISFRFAEQKIANIEAEIALTQTARSAYSHALTTEVVAKQ
tara:strand:- start:245 stop:640 length:396 start_codon:yes stop_codon:yes gene_type:complete